jgi:hypothetical protein
VSVAAAEVNVVAARRLWPRGLISDDLTDADRRALRQHAEVEERLDNEDVTVDLANGSAGQRSTGRERDQLDGADHQTSHY